MDTSGFLALISPNDSYHPHAQAFLTQVSREHWRTFTSNFMVAEAHALFLVRLGYQRATAFLRQMPESSTVVVRVSRADEERAHEIIYQYADKLFSFTDATSFAIMERLHIGVALTSDHHFVQYGFQALGL
jgi:predicted nucleic acid-binding protein